MTGLPPSDLLLPSGSAGDVDLSVPTLFGGQLPATSPLHLPRGINGCNPLAVPSSTANGPNGPNGPCQTNDGPGSDASPLSFAIRGRPPIQPNQLSTRSLPLSTRDIHQQFLRQQQRSFSLSPIRGIASAVEELAQNGLSLDGIAGSFPFGSLPMSQQDLSSPEAVHEPSQVHRLLQQNARLRSAWAAERKFLEANRERAEEVHREEQAIMDQERVSWDLERTQMFQQLTTLRQVRAELETERLMLRQEVESLRARLALLTSGGHRVSAAVSASARAPESEYSSHVIGGGDASHDVGPVAFQPTSLVPIQTDVGVGHGTTTRTSSNPSIKTTMVPCNPRPSAPAKGSGLEPVVDVQQIHPDLEGIPIKTNAVQRPTFTDGPSPAASRGASRTESPTDFDKTPPAQIEASVDDKTLQVLSAYEADRLTMHAGHTPNHSRTTAPTTTGSGVPTAASSGACTPIATTAKTQKVQVSEEDEDRRDSSISVSEPSEPVPSNASHLPSVDGEPVLESSEDRALKGPLMVRNIPANDEVFFKELSDKLEEVRRSPEIALPAVLRDSYFPDDATDAGESSEAAASIADEEMPDHDKTPQPGEGDALDEELDKELEIPLKMKKSSNFGAPFGECR